MVGNIGVLKHCVTGRDEWPDVRPTLGDQGHPIHRAWHVNVGEQHRDLIGELGFCEEPPVLRFFAGKMKSKTDWPNQLADAFERDFGPEC